MPNWRRNRVPAVAADEVIGFDRRSMTGFCIDDIGDDSWSSCRKDSRVV
jgi:hypothetical protein